MNEYIPQGIYFFQLRSWPHIDTEGKRGVSGWRGLPTVRQEPEPLSQQGVLGQGARGAFLTPAFWLCDTGHAAAFLTCKMGRGLPPPEHGVRAHLNEVLQINPNIAPGVL